MTTPSTPFGNAPVATLEQARVLDRADPLARFRDAFVIEDPDLLYLDGNSLGRLPVRTREHVRHAVDVGWGRDLIRSWSETPSGGDWFDAPARIGDRIGSLIGAAAGQVTVSDSTSVNLFKLAMAALGARPGRSKIVSDTMNFPSDLYVLQGAARAAVPERTLALVPAASGEIEPDLDALDAAIDDSTALVSLSLVTFKSGYLYDAAALTERAHRSGALVLWDLSHAAGAVPLDLDRWNVDLAVGCSYKYLNGGPGAPAFLYVNQVLQPMLESPIWGWFGQTDPFGFGLTYRPVEGVGRFMVGTPPVLSTLAIEPGLELLLEAGMPALRDKSLALGSFLIAAFEARLEPLGFSLGSPRPAERRGSHLSLRHPDARRIGQALREHGVIPDFREPDNLRFGLVPLYTSFEDVWRAVDVLANIVSQGGHERVTHVESIVT